MSFPTRPPIGMPPMAPGMGYAFAPMGMMPMGMGMMPQTTVMRPIVTTSSSQISVASKNKKLIPQEIPKDDKEEKPPVTTVFVGNISDRAPDAMIRQMLQRCGNVLSWKRVQGASGKLQAFGFCEYEDPEATLRCMRLLNEWEISDKKLVVKVDAKTKTLLDEYRSKKKAKSGDADESKDKEKKENGEDEKDDDKEKKDEEKADDELDEFTKREDRVAKAGLDAIMREYAGDLAKKPYSEIEKEAKPTKKKEEKEIIIKDTGIDDIDIEDDKKEIISREIRSFRDLHKGEDETDKEKDLEKERERERERMRILEEKRRRDRERAKERERDREKEREMERQERQEREKERDRIRSRTRSRSRSRDRDIRKRSRSRDRDRRRDRDAEDEEEAYERRKLEKKLREKEAAYQERLKAWEARERKKAREYEKEREREDERKAEEVREARRLKEFLEDYDDERDDPKFYKGSCLMRRLKEREKEREADTRDRQREKEELDEIKRKLLEEGHPDPEAELEKIEREREEHLKPRLNLNEESSRSPSPKEARETSEAEEEDEPMPEEKPAPLPPNMKATMRPVEASNGASSMSEDNEDSNFPPASEDSQGPMYGPSKEESQKLGFSGLKLGAGSPSEGGISGKRKKLTIGDVFNQDDDDSGEGAKKRKLVPIEYDDDKAEKKPTTAEEKRVKIKQLIESIPTAKDELFAYPCDWSIVDQSLMDKRIKPWVNKKIIEYIGEEEPTLTDFICQKVMARSGPQNILNDVAMVLDEEAEVFVVKMWRLLVYETEAKKLGLVK
ncbi:hypothetical protein FSP39_023680 [Pinctada imbricata]|uniref:RNA-binding protein 25 n=1 Tax=Pinctada imbricata TaxID=66713 RepID=A0AA89BV09_PINIB|nr:hypothetical protein FSP39_023680 [Pinctada imbricata]